MAYIGINLPSEHYKTDSSISSFRKMSIKTLKIYEVSSTNKECEYYAKDLSFLMFTMITKREHNMDLMDVIHNDTESPVIIVADGSYYDNNIYTFLREMHIPVKHMFRIGLTFYVKGKSIVDMINKCSYEQIYHPASCQSTSVIDDKLRQILQQSIFMDALYDKFNFINQGQLPGQYDAIDSLAFTPYIDIVMFAIDGYSIAPANDIDDAEYAMRFDSEYRKHVHMCIKQIANNAKLM